ncbi:MAG: twin-arginine translocase TatA/TatE family subunit [Victivallaceae bacterium]|nr:twin-arginine translocase TatA/TatE family subunit [Victivallaceae bacterium]
MGLGWQELLIIFLIVLLVFGARRIPDIARSLGKATKEFKKAKDNIVKESEEMMDASEKLAEKDSKKDSDETDESNKS